MHTRGLITAAMLLLAGGTAAAQDHGRVGVTAGYPSTIGIIWHASDKIAIRPEISVSGGSSGSTAGSFDTDANRWSLGTGASVLFYLHTYERLRTYISPSLSYAHVSSTSTSSGLSAALGITTASVTTTGRSIEGAGSFGAQYSLSDKFSVFGELGFGVSHAWSTSTLTSTRVTGNTWGTRTAVAMIFYP
jgi:hypothetical protein